MACGLGLSKAIKSRKAPGLLPGHEVPVVSDSMAAPRVTISPHHSPGPGNDVTSCRDMLADSCHDELQAHHVRSQQVKVRTL